jgi:hypothetical protein
MEPGTAPIVELIQYTGYRLSDAIFWLLPVLAVLTCFVHAARRAHRQPTPNSED